MGTRRAWIVWGVGVFAYVVAVLQRTSLGVAGLAAAARFGASASVVASFAVLQLIVYAALQIPVGVLLDRFGSHRMVVVGAGVMAAGQVTLAVADSVPLAVLGRVLVGAGDAMTFVSVLRLVPAWFPGRRVPLLSQVTGLVGQLGQVLSAIPLVALLRGPGWTPAFLSAAGLGLLAGVLALALVHDTPQARVARGLPVSPSRVARDLRTAWRHPGTRLGLWTHFVTQFSGSTFALMWGYPFLVSGAGVGPATASALLTAFVVAGIAFGPVVGVLVQRHPYRRSNLVLAVVAANVLAWLAVIAWPGRPPVWLLVLLVLALASGGPGSMIGFDFARTFNAPNRLGTATGIVNVGGFVATLVTILLIGVVLDVVRPGGGYGHGDFRLAMAVQVPVWAVGLAGVLRTRRLVRRRLAVEQGVVVRPLHEVIRARRAARRNRPRD